MQGTLDAGRGGLIVRGCLYVVVAVVWSGLLLAPMFSNVSVSYASAFASKGSGSLTVRVSGLPKGQRPAAVLRGPHGLRRSVPARGLSIAKAKVGSYRLMLSAVKITRASGSIRRGATATALNRKVSVHLSAGHHTVLRGSYTSIINPGLKTFRGTVVSVIGAAEDPSRVVLQGHVSLARHAILSLPPSSMLPRGLLSKVVGVAYAPGKTTVSIKAASVYEVAPNFQFDAPLAASAQASASDAAASCGPAAGLTPYRHIKDVSFSGGWDTVSVLGVHITDGVKAAVHFTAEAGLNVTAGAGLACSLSASFFASGMAGPIPVTAGIEGDLDGSAAIGGALTTGGSVHVNAGAHTVGVPPALVWLPDVSFSDPQFAFNAKSFAPATAGIGFTVKAGIGNGNIASVTLNMGTSVNFSARPGTCDWSAKFGQFSAEGQLLDWHITTPKTPALFTQQLGGNFCATSGSGGGGGGSPGSGSDSIALTDPGNQSNVVGTPVHLQVQANDAEGAPLTYNATGLPFGLTIDPSSGLITGTPTTAGNSTVTLTVENGRGQSDTLNFGWLVSLAAAQVGWTVEPIQVPTGATQAGLRAVSCAEATACMGVGYSEGGPGGSGPLTETWDGSSWILSSAVSPGPGYGFLGVSCPSATWCAAVGSDSGEAFAETWNGTTWTKETIAAPPGSEAYTLLSVSCTSPSHCIAVGDYTDGEFGADQALAEDWDGSTWTEGNAVDPSPGAVPGDANSELRAISCTTPSSCVAVGEYEDQADDTHPALAESWDGSIWTVDPTPPIPHAYQTILNSVSCWASNSCMAVGAYDILGNPPPEGNTVSENWDGSAWHLQAAPVLPETFSELHGISCTSATFCIALGYGSPGASYVALWNGAWTDEPFGAALDAISCVSETYCIAVGAQNAALYAAS